MRLLYDIHRTEKKQLKSHFYCLAKPKLIVVVGPTASGKSALAVKVAKQFDGEIVSADSRQIYRGMNIGTAKMTKKEMGEIEHHLINIKNPDEEYTVAQYKKDAVDAIEKIIKRGKLPILAGGTGLYVKAVVENLEIPEVKANAKLRERLEREVDAKGIEHLFRQLVKLDPEAAYIVDGKNPRRVIRALEIAITTKKPFSAQRKKGTPLFDTLQIGIMIPQEKLRKRIETRVDEMVKDGLVNEVNGLIKKYGSKPVAFDAIGYREIIQYLAADKCRSKKLINADTISINQPNLHGSVYSLLEAVADIKKKTWAFAKRQMTWFSAKGRSASGGKKDKEIKWVKNEKEAIGLIKKFLPKT